MQILMMKIYIIWHLIKRKQFLNGELCELGEFSFSHKGNEELLIRPKLSKIIPKFFISQQLSTIKDNLLVHGLHK